jgi:hypothetical protein
MRFLDFPDWLGQLSLIGDSTWLGMVLVVLSLVHVYLAIVLSTKVTVGIFIKTAICIALFELPVITILLVYIAGLPKA